MDEDTRLLGDGRPQPKRFRFGDGVTSIRDVEAKGGSTNQAKNLYEAFEEFGISMEKLVEETVKLMTSPAMQKLMRDLENGAGSIEEARRRSKEDVDRKRREMRRRGRR